MSMVLTTLSPLRNYFGRDGRPCAIVFYHVEGARRRVISQEDVLLFYSSCNNKVNELRFEGVLCCQLQRMG